MNNRLINTKVAAAGGCTDIVDNYDPFGGNGVALYQLNGNANDVSTNYNGTWSGTESYSTGVFGQAGVFNGSSYIYNNILDTSTTKAISIWVKANDFNDGWPFQQGDGQGVENYIRFYNTDDIQVRIGNVTQTFSGYSTNTWYHIVAQTNASGNANVWINGVEVGTSTAPTSLTVNRTNIGARYNLSSFEKYFNGSIDQVRVFNTALDPLEVEALYTEELCICDGTVDTLQVLGDTSCIATYQLDGNANDLSGNYSGTPTDVSYGVGEFDLSGVFNGSSSIIKNGDLGVDFRGQTELSVSCWFKTNQSVSLQSLFGFSATGDASTELFVNIRSDEGNALGFINRNDGAGIVEVRASGSGSVIDDVWHNVVFVASASGTKLYLDGSELTSMTYRTGSASTQISMPSDLNQFNIGGSQDSGGIEFLYNGSIDQVRIFNKALSLEEVGILFNDETPCS